MRVPLRCRVRGGLRRAVYGHEGGRVHDAPQEAWQRIAVAVQRGEQRLDRERARAHDGLRLGQAVDGGKEVQGEGGRGLHGVLRHATRDGEQRCLREEERRQLASGALDAAARDLEAARLGSEIRRRVLRERRQVRLDRLGAGHERHRGGERAEEVHRQAEPFGRVGVEQSGGLCRRLADDLADLAHEQLIRGALPAAELVELSQVHRPGGVAREQPYDLAHLLANRPHYAAQHLVRQRVQLGVLVPPQRQQPSPEPRRLCQQKRAREAAELGADLVAAVPPRVLGRVASERRAGSGGKVVQVAAEQLQRCLGRAKPLELTRVRQRGAVGTRGGERDAAQGVRKHVPDLRAPERRLAQQAVHALERARHLRHADPVGVKGLWV